MKIKVFMSVVLGMALLLGGCTTSSSGGSSSGMPSGMPGSIPGGMPGGSSGSAGMPGDVVIGDSGSSSSSDAGASTRSSGEEATTADERRGTLEKSLDDSLGEFDKTLDEEQRRTAAERDAQAAGRAASSGTDEQRGEGGIGRREGDLRSERTAQSGSAGGDASAGGRDRGTVSGAGGGAPDRGIPSGDDDDIVARRLRRAAEQETDPELKEKLWKEYTEYKRNAQGRS